MEPWNEAKREEQRQAYLNEVGTEPPCPMCGKPRVKRSNYVRCNPCGENWQAGDDLTISAKLDRYRKMWAKNTPPTKHTDMGKTNDGAQPAA